MSVQTGDMKWYMAGGVLNLNPQVSWGGARSTYELSSGALNNLFDTINGTNHTAGKTDTGQNNDYRVIVFRLGNPLLDASSSQLQNAVLKITSNTLHDSNIQAYVSAAVNTQFTAGINENTAPTQGGPITFVSIPGGGLNLPAVINPGDEVHIALKRAISAGSTPNTDGLVLQVQGTTL